MLAGSCHRLLVVLAIAMAGLGPIVLTGCGSSSSTGGGLANEAVPADSSAVQACDDFPTWREAQDALEASGEDEGLDPDGDGVACVEELGQTEYVTGWESGYGEACAWIFSQSSTGELYDDSGTGYSETDCSTADPGANLWEGDSASEPEEVGASDGWQAACEETFGTLAGYSDLQLSDEGVEVAQADCEAASSY